MSVSLFIFWSLQFEAVFLNQVTFFKFCTADRKLENNSQKIWHSEYCPACRNRQIYPSSYLYTTSRANIPPLLLTLAKTEQII